MNRKYYLVTAAVFMILIGFLRGIGGILLFSNGNQLNSDNPIIANNLQTSIVAAGLILICVLFITAAINLLKNFSKRSWIICWYILILFLLDGALNGYLLFGQPLEQGQIINLTASVLTGTFLFLGKPALRIKNKIHAVQNNF